MTDVATNPATATPDASVADASANGQTAEGNKRQRSGLHVQLTVPPDLKALIKAKADEADRSESRWILENIASDLGFTLPEPTRSTSKPTLSLGLPKDMSKEAKAARFDVARELLAKLQAGESIDLDAMRAKLEAAK